MARFALDCDGTLFKWAKYPELGAPVPGAIETCKELLDKGHELILWTCRDGDALELVIDECDLFGITFVGYNVHPEQDHLSVKVNADVFIDDKGIGCPLIIERSEKSLQVYVDWVKIRKLLKHYL